MGSKKKSFKDLTRTKMDYIPKKEYRRIMEQFVETMKALADIKRVKILKALQYRSLCVCEIQSLLGINQPSVSKHLRILEKAGFVSRKKAGLWVEYALSQGNDSPYVASILGNLKHWLESSNEIKSMKNNVFEVCRKEICNKPNH